MKTYRVCFRYENKKGIIPDYTDLQIKESFNEPTIISLIKEKFPRLTNKKIEILSLERL